MKKYSFFQLVDELDEGVDDEAALVHLAIKSGLRLSAKEAVELVYYDTGAEQAILGALTEPLSEDQQKEIEEFLQDEE
jgi:hypothetical protein